MRIKLRANNLIKKYHTRDPYELAAYLNINVISKPIRGPVHGFYDKVLRRKFIVINSNLPEHLQRQTCAHEVGHALLHKGWGYYFMIEHTFFSPGRLEREANEFAWHLLYDQEYCQYAYEGYVDRYVKEEGLTELSLYAEYDTY